MIVHQTIDLPRILKQIGRPLLLFLAVSIAATAINSIEHPFKAIALPDVTISLLGAVLSILLGFRTNSAYARWWEARQLWGSLVNSSRSLARQAISSVTSESDQGLGARREAARTLIYHQIGFVHSLRCALRRQEPWEDLRQLFDSSTISALRKEQNVPAAILVLMGQHATKAASMGLITELRLQRFDSTLTDLSNVQGGCERIKNTPLPRQYDIYPELLVKVYCMLLPFIMVDQLKLLTAFVTSVVSFAFLVLNVIGKNLEDPFENTVYDTPMTALSRTIEINLRQILGEQELPPPVLPVNGVLW